MNHCKSLAKTLKCGLWVNNEACEVERLEIPATRRQDNELRQVRLQYPDAVLAVVTWCGGAAGWTYKIKTVCVIAHLDGDPLPWYRAVARVRSSERAIN